MDTDDRPVGTVLDRREFLAVLAAAGAGFLAACTGLGDVPAAAPTTAALTATPTAALPTFAASTAAAPTSAPTAAQLPTARPLPACIVRPETTEGPYFLDGQLDRSDIRAEPSDGSLKEGALLALAFSVSQVTPNGCLPLAGAIVDIWHCDALGVYSGVAGSPGTKFLRGYQLTDENGLAQFTTVYPGWYPGRTVHIHFKIRLDAPGGSYDFTSQLFFDDAITDQVFTQPPYASRGPRNVRNQADNIFRSGGDQLLLAPTPADAGYQAVFHIGLQLGG